MSFRFYINRTEAKGGPSIFGLRLKNALIKNEWKWSFVLPQVNLMFSTGIHRPMALNVLRLDGLYMDLMNTIGDSQKKNEPIRRSYLKAKAIVFQSQFSQKLFSAFWGKADVPTRVIPNGVPETFSPDGKAAEYGFKKTILCSGRWVAHKRLSSIVDGFIKLDDPDCGLVILGQSDHIKLPEHSNIKQIGHISYDQLPYYLRGADAFVHLSWLDNCPNCVIEAMACGLPVLCTHNGGTSELVRGNGVIIRCEDDYDFGYVDLYNPPMCDANQVADGMQKILNWRKKIDRKRFGIDQVAAEYIRFITMCMKALL